MKLLEFAINKFYKDFERNIYLLASGLTIVICAILFMQYFYLKSETEKMILIKEEYHCYLDKLKQIIKDNNCDIASTDLDSMDDSQQTENNDTTSAVLDVLLHADVDIDALKKEEEFILDEQDEDTDKFQFVSLEDEKQLKDLRNATRQAVAVSRKKSKAPQPKNTIAAQQIAQLKKSVSQKTNDFTFHWPLELHHFWLSSLFGARKKADGSRGFHYGIDLAALRGTPVKAAAAGVVIQAQYLPGYGNNILIQHNKYYRTRYAHLQKMNVSVGQKVTQGQKIGAVGDTGAVRKSGHDASHLHFEIYHNGSHVNPLRYLFN